MNDRYPDELPAEDGYPPEVLDRMDHEWDKHVEEMYWHELMTMPPIEESDQGQSLRGG